VPVFFISIRSVFRGRRSEQSPQPAQPVPES
jgi:hypothetical protein